MTDDEIDAAARHMLTEMIVRHVQPGTDRWHNALARHCPEATVTDREYIAMRAAELVGEWQRKP